MESLNAPGRSGIAWWVLRAVLLGFGLVLGGNAVWLAFTANLTVGTAMAAVLALGFLAWGILLPKLRWFINALAILICLAVVAMSVFLASFGRQDSAHFDEDAVIVLGAAVHGRELSNTLVARLNQAISYHQRNPRAVIVVSGGQGPQEDLPEAVAMREYLLGAGIPDASILVEDRSTSTEENFVFSKAMLDDRLPPGYTIAFVTNEFHAYRAGLIASATGLSARHTTSQTPWYFSPTNYLREGLAVVTWWLAQI